MANLARQEMYFRQFISVDEIIARIDEVTAAEVQAMAQRLFDPASIAVTCSAASTASSSSATGWSAEEQGSGVSLRRLPDLIRGSAKGGRYRTAKP